MSNFILPISTMVFACIFLFFSLSLPEAKEGIGPGGWPTAVLSLIILLVAVLFIRVCKEEKVKKAQMGIPQALEGEETEGGVSIGQVYPYRHWIVGGIIFLYIFIIQFVGMALTTPFFIMAMARTLGLRGWVKLTLIALICTAFVIGLFGIVLGLSLPRGMGVFRNMSSFFY